MVVRDVEFAKPYFGDAERDAVNRVMATSWLASGPETEAFEHEFAAFLEMPHALAVNSGSAANLLALAALDLPPGSKVLTSGCGFPATLAPILHLGLEPVLIDYELPAFNIDLGALQAKIGECRAVLLAHTMGSPVDMRYVVEAARRHGVQVVEDCCEALGATIDNRQVGTFGEAGTFSFYPSHQITALGGGGMVVFHDSRHYERARSMRDWGKLATWDKLGRTDTAYTTDVDGIPYFAHYTYATVGHNMRLPDACSAFGREQLKRLRWIVSERHLNHSLILARLSSKTRDRVRTAIPVRGATPSWFGVILLVDADRQRFGDGLEIRGVRHRPFFAGNITRHPPYAHLKRPFPVADRLMKQAVFIGCWAGMTREDIEHVSVSIEQALDGI